MALHGNLSQQQLLDMLDAPLLQPSRGPSTPHDGLQLNGVATSSTPFTANLPTLPLVGLPITLSDSDSSSDSEDSVQVAANDRESSHDDVGDVPVVGSDVSSVREEDTAGFMPAHDKDAPTVPV